MRNFTLKELAVHPDSLLLDIHNPRFYGEPTAPRFPGNTHPDDPRPQETVRQYLLRHQGVPSLVESILQQGFLSLDRLVVRELEPGKYVVVEGNRRLAAIKTILGKVAFRLISPPEHVLATLACIEVLLLRATPNEIGRSALLLQGVRHISGVRSWGPFQQGKLIHALTQQERMSFRDAAAAVGMSPSRVSSLLRGYCGLAQMQAHPVFGEMADASLFSYFEQAYAKLPVREWLGWQDSSLRYEQFEHLESFYAWIVGVDGRPPRLLARHVRDMLPAVLTQEEARSAFVAGQASIEEAYRLSREGAEGYSQLARHAAELKRLMKHLGLDGGGLEGVGLEAVRQLHQLTASLLARGATVE